MTNYDENTRPTRTRIAISAVFLGVQAGVLAWLVEGELEDPSIWGKVGVLAYAGLTGFYIWGLVKLIRRRWAGEKPVGDPVAYTDRDGDRWNVRPDGSMVFAAGNGGVWPREVVERVFGPLVPVTE